MRRFLDRLYAASGALAGVCLASIAGVMLLQAAMREAGMLFRGADDIVGWLCAASAFLALAYTFRHGELVRVGLVLERLAPRPRRALEFFALGSALVVVAAVTWAAAHFVYQSWQFDEVAQGLIQIPIWIPQLSLVLGATVFLVAVLDDFIVLLRGGTPRYRAAEDAQRTQAATPTSA